METHHKGSKGFMRGKLVKAKSFLRVNSNIKPSSTPLQCSFNKVSPSPPYSPTGSMASSNGQSHSNSSSIQRVMATARPTSNSYGSMEFPPVISQSTQKVSDAHYKRSSFHDYVGDENVDIKTASYISYVRERFRLEKIDSEPW